mgnify:CR=1 FL=1|tara:strand:+ start:13757 stop:14056 length:300 start_codon:yes stop_codon:yes gene_type:complete
MGKLNLQGSKFSSDLLFEINDKLKNFKFKNPYEFMHVADVLRLVTELYLGRVNKKPKVQLKKIYSFNQISEQLQKNIEALLEHLAEPENYISLDYVFNT